MQQRPRADTHSRRLTRDLRTQAKGCKKCTTSPVLSGNGHILPLPSLAVPELVFGNGLFGFRQFRAFRRVNDARCRKGGAWEFAIDD